MSFKISRNEHQGRQLLKVSLRDYCPLALPPVVSCPGSPERFDSPEIGISGRDFPGVRFEIVAGPGEAIKAGQVVMRDRRRPEIVFTSPVNGHVSRVERGPRRSLNYLVIDVEAANFTAFDDSADIEPLSPGHLLSSGIWTTFRTRPFGHIPDPDSRPEAIFVNAANSGSTVPDPFAVIGLYQDWFDRGLNALSECFNVPVYICSVLQGMESMLRNVSSRVTLAEFDGSYFAGLPGTHIEALCPVGGRDRLSSDLPWQIDLQDVIAIGHYCDLGRPWSDRMVALSEAEGATPRVAVVPVGASIAALSPEQPAAAPNTMNELSTKFIGLLDRHIFCSEDNGCDSESLQYRSLIPTPDLDNLSPPGILAVPLLRALLTGNVDRVRELGGLELLEEDLEPLSAASSAGANYGVLLRDVLEQLHEEVSGEVHG